MDRGFPPLPLRVAGVTDSVPSNLPVLRGELQSIGARMAVGRRPRSKVRIRIVGSSSIGWVEAVEAWGAEVEAVVVSLPDIFKDIRGKLSFTPITTPHDALHLLPLGAWDGCMFATIITPEDSQLVSSLFKRWRPAIAVLSTHSSISRADTIAILPSEIPSFYHKKMITLRHQAVGGVSSSSWRFTHYTRWLDILSYPSLMTSITLPRFLQTALSDTNGGARGVTFEPRQGVNPPLAIGVLSSSLAEKPTFVFSGDGTGPDLYALQPRDRHFWVYAHSVFSKTPILRQVKTDELMAIWDYEGKLESRVWSREHSLRILRARLLSPPAKMLRRFVQAACDAILLNFYNAGGQDLTDHTPFRYTKGLTCDIPFSPLEDKVTTRVGAAQTDFAEVDLTAWASPSETEEVARARVILRRFAARWWAYYLERDAMRWWNSNGRDPTDLEAIEDCIFRARATSYWHWHRGSRLFFWRFPKEFQKMMRDGTPFYHLAKSPVGFAHNMPAPSREAEIETRKKVFQLRFRHFIERGFTDLITQRFSVVKLEVDGVILEIRVVWNSSSNGHNATLWAPGFMLDDIGDVIEMVTKWLSVPVATYLDNGSPSEDYTRSANSFVKSKQGDIDVGAMFNNFRTHPSERHALGVRVINTRPQGEYERHEFWRFCALHFGGRPSPYLACQSQRLILELCKGDRRDPKNHWQWETVRLNLPGDSNYDPSMPRVMLLRRDGELATREADYVDDIHPCIREKPGSNEARRACAQLKSEMNSFGNQADDRKYRLPTLTPGAWNGVIIHTDTPFPMMSTTQKKWTRFKTGLSWILTEGRTTGSLSTGELRKIAGLGVNLMQVYRDAKCYLKGIFNAIEAFRSDRDPEGWRVESSIDSAEMLEYGHGVGHESPLDVQEDYPLQTKVTSELLLHAEALQILFMEEQPLMVPLRPTDKGKLRFFIGDASREGFGGATQYPDGIIDSREGLWESGFATGGSNLREAQNQVNHLLWEIRDGRHDGCELWAATDNAVWSAVWTKGMSNARHLFDLVLTLKQVARKHEVFLHCFHISGDRMIASGVDGLSRGNYDSGISLGFDIRQFMPLNVSAWDVAGNVLGDWCKSWMGKDFAPPLTPEEWFEKGHFPGVHIWTPPPGAALIALKELSRSRHKRPLEVTHVVMIPRLLWDEEWRSRFEKEVDFWFILHNGSLWPHSAFEPLLVGISFPILPPSSPYPWQVKQERTRMVDMGRSLSQMSKSSDLRVGNYLRELWLAPRTFPGL